MNETRPDYGNDLLAEARATRAEIMRTGGGRNAQARLAACNAILADAALVHLTDEQLVAHLESVEAEAQRRGLLDG